MVGAMEKWSEGDEGVSFHGFTLFCIGGQTGSFAGQNWKIGIITEKRASGS
jgi:hypothetical protein